jgi:hypothetical protein
LAVFVPVFGATLPGEPLHLPIRDAWMAARIELASFGRRVVLRLISMAGKRIVAALVVVGSALPRLVQSR